MKDICETLYTPVYPTQGIKDIDDDWKNIHPATTHSKEFQVINIISNYLISSKLPFHIERIIEDNKENMWSDYDARVYTLNMDTLHKGLEIIKIDFERKPKDVFVGGRCPEYWSHANFLYRKIKKTVYLNSDLYILHDKDLDRPEIIWASFGTIRSIGRDNKNKNRENRFYSISKKNYDRLQYGYKSLLNYIVNFKPERKWF